LYWGRQEADYAARIALIGLQIVENHGKACSASASFQDYKKAAEAALQTEFARPRKVRQSQDMARLIRTCCAIA
jgi:hypothetical protein